MYKLIRIFNQNRRKILIVILIIVFVIFIIQLLNYFAQNKQNNYNKQNNIIMKNTNNTGELISNKSAISGENVSENKLKKDTDIIKKFLNYCNEGNKESAYEMLTDECKEVMFPTIQDFENIYYSNIFNGEQKNYTIENLMGDTYEVKFSGDILGTGKLDEEDRLDNITLIKEGQDYKLNINNYVERKEKNKTTEDKKIRITILNVDTYMDYEVYNLSIENNSDHTIMLDTNDDSKSVYLEDSKKMKYYFYNNEIIQNRLEIQSKFKGNIQIKFNNSYSSSRSIKNLVFSKIILDYDSYKNLQNKDDYDDFFEFKVNV